MYQLTKTQKEIQKAATEFAKGEFEAEQARELEKGGQFPGRLWEQAGELGFIGVHFPEEYGGGGLGLLEQVLVSEAFCVQDPHRPGEQDDLPGVQSERSGPGLCSGPGPPAG